MRRTKTHCQLNRHNWMKWVKVQGDVKMQRWKCSDCGAMKDTPE